jgi:uncharacterized cupredoxin-like copper-binding protein
VSARSGGLTRDQVREVRIGHPSYGHEPGDFANRVIERTSEMKLLNALLAAALMGVSLGAVAHEGEDHGKKKDGPVRKEQKDWGIAGDTKAVKHTVELVMSDDMRFTPDKLEVRQGDTVRFLVRNSGKQMHEIVIGTKKVLDEHAAVMLKFPNMEHDEPYMAHVAPGKVGEVVWTFNRPGEFDFACLIAGHYQAGMVGKVKVAAGKG